MRLSRRNTQNGVCSAGTGTYSTSANFPILRFARAHNPRKIRQYASSVMPLILYGRQCFWTLKVRCRFLILHSIQSKMYATNKFIGIAHPSDS